MPLVGLHLMTLGAIWRIRGCRKSAVEEGLRARNIAMRVGQVGRVASGERDEQTEGTPELFDLIVVVAFSF